MKIRVIDGPPGSGKTRWISERANAEGWGPETAIIVYTNDAAAEVRRRIEAVTGPVVGTVYSQTWGGVGPFVSGGKKVFHGGSTWKRRKIEGVFDPALRAYTETAPSRRARTVEDGLAQQLHAWDGEEDPPIDIERAKATGPLRYILPAAKWIQGGAPLPPTFDLFERIIIDEAQDMSTLELVMALALAAPDAEVTCLGDPGQAIFSNKWQSLDNRDYSPPPAWLLAGAERETMSKGWRVGDPVATKAAAVLSTYWDRPPETFRAEHETAIREWNPSSTYSAPSRGLALGYSRGIVNRYFQRWNLSNVAVAPQTGSPDSELVLCTGHAAKGAQSDDVYILPWGAQAMRRLEEKAPNELRLLYVMMTRARKNLFVPYEMLVRMF